MQISTSLINMSSIGIFQNGILTSKFNKILIERKKSTIYRETKNVGIHIYIVELVEFNLRGVK